MTTKTIPSFADAIAAFAKQFTHPVSPTCEPITQVIVLCSATTWANTIWKDRLCWESPLHIICVNDEAFAKFQEKLGQEIPDGGEEVDWSILVDPSTLARLALNLEVQFPEVYELDLWSWHTLRQDHPELWSDDHPGLDGYNTTLPDGCRLNFTVLPTDWQSRVDELSTLANSYGVKAYPEQLWDPPAHDYTTHTYE